MRQRVSALVQVNDTEDHLRLERLLASPRLSIDATFTLTGDQTLNALAGRPFEVTAVVCDGLVGHGTLEKVADGYPNMPTVELRVGTSRAETLADQVVQTPWDVKKVEAALIAAVYLGDGISTGDLLELIQAAKNIPSIPDTYVKLQQELGAADPSVDTVAEIISADAGISLRTLQFVNSAAVGLRRHVQDLSHAITLLGLRTVANLVLAAGVFDQAASIDRKFVATLWDESMRVSQLAYRIAKEERCDPSVVEGVRLAGLLHDIGDLVLFQNWREQFNKVDPANRIEDERMAFGATHADVGGYLAALWGMRADIVRGIRFHHDPATLRSETLDTASILHVARGLVDANLDASSAELDTDLLDRLGHRNAPDRWASLAD